QPLPVHRPGVPRFVGLSPVLPALLRASFPRSSEGRRPSPTRAKPEGHRAPEWLQNKNSAAVDSPLRTLRFALVLPLPISRADVESDDGVPGSPSGWGPIPKLAIVASARHPGPPLLATMPPFPRFDQLVPFGIRRRWGLDRTKDPGGSDS